MRTAEFLKAIWDLSGYYVIGVHLLNGGWQWFVANPEGAEKILDKYKETADIYYGVNPRANEPKSGKGSDSDISQANTFFADLDFKEKKDCKPGIYKDDPETFELELCYEEGEKTVYVHRPPLQELLRKLEEVKLTPVTFIIDSGNGYQILWKNKYPVEAEEWKKREEELIRTLQKAGLPADPQVKDISRVLRLPGSINHRNGREAKIIYVGEIVAVLPEKYERIINAVLPCFTKAEDKRFELVGHLSGFLVRRGIPLHDAEAIVEELYNRAGISPPEHGKDVKYTYKDYETGGNVTGFPELQALCEELGSPINTKLLGESGKTKKQGKEEEPSVREERPIQSFDTLRIYHDFQHGKAYVSTYKAVREKREMKGIQYWANVVKIDKTYINEDGNIHVLTEEERDKLKEEYLEIEYLVVEPNEFPELNLPTEIKEDVKISEVYKKVLEFIKQRVTFRYEEDYVAVVVWMIDSYFYRVFTAFPYLAPLKAGYNSGGSQLLWALSKIMPRPKIFIDPTPASIYTSVEQKDVTQLFDEFRDNVNKERIEEIKNILRAGYMSNGTVQRVEMTKHGRVVRDFNAYSPKVIIDQSLITSEYDIASRCLFIWLIRDPRRRADVSDERPIDLINELYSVFLKYAPQVNFLYKNMETEFTGRYDQLFRPLLVIARLIDAEDESLHVHDQLLIALNRSISFSESIAMEGDPQKKVIQYVIEYIKNSIGEFVEGRISTVPKPWHVYSEGEGEVYIFLSDLRKEIMEYAVEVYQKDISYRGDQRGGEPLTVREWEKADPEITEMLRDRKFTALLKKFFPENIKEHRWKNIFVLKFDDYSKIISPNFSGSPSGANSGGVYTPGLRDNTLSQRGEQKYESLKSPVKNSDIPPNSGSNSGSVINIQNKGSEKENSKSDAELSFNSSLRFSNKNTEPGLINPAQSRLNPGSEIKSQSQDYYEKGSEKNKSALGMTAKEQKIYDFLKKLSKHKYSAMPLKKLTKEELKLLPELREKELVNFDDRNVWLTFEGYIYLKGGDANDTIDKILQKIGQKFTEEELRKAISEVTGCPDTQCQDTWIEAIGRRVREEFPAHL
uniref:Putative replication protein RepA n=1 Tax=Saccharolobus islandicus TaxID=43080 RepID=A8TKN3_SACIS|nr:hypothetical protein [Sulfolobus islandicus]ABV26262.1 putative replication protein RepA [Sulfolobus islandicus]